MISNETRRADPLANHNAPRPTTYADAAALLGSVTMRKIGHNTYLERGLGASIGVRFHATTVVRFHADGTMTLDAQGYRTSTTKERMNRYLPDGYRIFQKAGTWRLDTPHGGTEDYRDGVTLRARA